MTLNHNSFLRKERFGLGHNLCVQSITGKWWLVGAWGSWSLCNSRQETTKLYEFVNSLSQNIHLYCMLMDYVQFFILWEWLTLYTFVEVSRIFGMQISPYLPESIFSRVLCHRTDVRSQKRMKSLTNGCLLNWWLLLAQAVFIFTSSNALKSEQLQIISL